MKMWDIRAPAVPQTHKRIVTEFGMGDEVWNSTPMQNFIMIR